MRGFIIIYTLLLAAGTCLAQDDADPATTSQLPTSNVTDSASDNSTTSATIEVTTPADEDEIVTPDTVSNETQVVPPPPNVKVFTKVLGNSGKILIGSDEGFSPESSVTLELDSVQELGRSKKGGKGGSEDAGLEPLKGGASSFNTFANQNFQFSDLQENTTYKDTNISCSSFSFNVEMQKRIKGTLTSIGNITLDVYVMKEDGNIVTDGERSQVTAGSVKVNVDTEFSFSEDGEALDVSFAVKGKGGKSVQKAKNLPGEDTDVYSLGGDTALKMSKKVEIDGQWQDMRSGFPLLETKGSSTVLRCRFDKFNSKAIYDPTIDLDLGGLEVVGDTTTPGGGANGLSTVSFMLLIAAVFTTLYL